MYNKTNLFISLLSHSHYKNSYSHSFGHLKLPTTFGNCEHSNMSLPKETIFNLDLYFLSLPILWVSLNHYH